MVQAGVDDVRAESWGWAGGAAGGAKFACGGRLWYNRARQQAGWQKMYPLGYNVPMIEIRQTETYADWFAKLRDRKARARIDVRIRRLSLGNPGDVRSVGEGVSELRIDYGPGYRVYFVQRGPALVILLAGGDKHTQDQDIQTALELAHNV